MQDGSIPAKHYLSLFLSQLSPAKCGPGDSVVLYYDIECSRCVAVFHPTCVSLHICEANVA